MKYPHGYIKETIKIIINNLNDDREHLALQLAFQQGLISETTFAKERAIYLKRTNFTRKNLLERTKILRLFIGDRASAEVVSAAFRCTIEEADSVLQELL